MFLIYDLPKSLRVLTFRNPIRLDIEFLEGALKYLSKLTSLNLYNIEGIFEAQQDDDMKVYFLKRLSELSKLHRGKIGVD